MKILIVCQFYYPEHFSITDVAEGLVKRGHDVFVVTGIPNYGMKKIYDGYEHVVDEVRNGVRIHRCRLKIRKDSRLSIITNYLSFWFNSKRYLRRLKEEFDVVYSMSLSPLISVVGATIYARKHKVKHILHCLDLWPESPVATMAIKRDSLFYKILYRWSRAIYSNIDEILVSSPSFEAYFRETLRLPDKKITYLPQPPMIAEPEGKVTYEHKYNFVYAGNIGILQLIMELIEATKIAREKIDCCLTLIGMGSLVEEVKKKIEAEHLEEFVHFEGIKTRSITAGYYKSATAMVVSLKADSSVGKTMPGKLSSGFYYGKPILGILQGDGRKALEESQGGVLAADETPESIAKAMLDMASLSEEELRKLGENNSRYFQDHFAVDTVVDSIEKYLS